MGLILMSYLVITGRFLSENLGSEICFTMNSSYPKSGKVYVTAIKGGFKDFFLSGKHWCGSILLLLGEYVFILWHR